MVLGFALSRSDALTLNKAMAYTKEGYYQISIGADGQVYSRLTVKAVLIVNSFPI